MAPERTIAELPGPPRLPWLGNTLQLLRPSRVHLTAERLVERYGPMVRLEVPRSTIVLLADREAIEAILRERPEGFRRWSSLRQVGEEMAPIGVFSAEGDEWRRQRRLVLGALNIHHLTRYFEVVRLCTERLGRRLAEVADGRPLAIGEEFSSFTVDVTSALALGDDLNTLERRDNALQGHLHRVMEMTGRRSATPIPYWRRFKLPADRALDRSVAAMREAVEGFIARARAL